MMFGSSFWHPTKFFAAGKNWIETVLIARRPTNHFCCTPQIALERFLIGGY